MNKICCHVGCQQEATCENEVRIGERKSIAYLCSEHHAEVLAYALKMQELIGMPAITIQTANQPLDDSTE